MGKYPTLFFPLFLRKQAGGDEFKSTWIKLNNMRTEKHYQNSSLRENIIEHLFIGELLKIAWHRSESLEIAKPEVDNSGYDLIAEINGIIRHIQLKSTKIGGKAARQNIHLTLSRKPAGCVVWIFFDEQKLELGPFLYFGGNRTESMEDIKDYKIATHTKGDSQGFKKKRPNIRVITKSSFATYTTVTDLYDKLFRKQ